MKRTIPNLTGAVFATCLLASAAFAQQTDSKSPTNVVKTTVVDSNWMPREMLGIPQINAKIPIKALQADQETGVMVLKVKYQAGFTNTWHTHPNAHGMYVLDGILKTHEGEHGPGSFV
jgi:quercetin dioxygenase-like cupin family protein